MVKGLQEIVEDFYRNQLPKRKEYISLYRSFLDYIDSNITPDIDAKTFVTKQFNERDVVQSCVKYFETSRARKESGIKKYLNAITYLYNNCFKEQLRWINTTLEGSMPFAKLTNDVKEQLHKLPEGHAPIPPICDSEFDRITKYLDYDFSKNSLAKVEFYLICNLLLLLGFKLERLRQLKLSDYIREKHALCVHCENGVSIEVRLPNNIDQHFSLLLDKYRPELVGPLFIDTKGKPISPAFLETHFKPLRQTLTGQSLPTNYNATGFAKFGVIRLLRTGLEPYFVQMITGMDQIIMDDCTWIYLQEKYPQISSTLWLTSHLNAKIGELKAYHKWT